jgi:hypothetical protein
MIPFYHRHAWMARALICIGLLALPAAALVSGIPSATEPKVEAQPTAPATPKPRSYWCTHPGQETCLYPQHEQYWPKAPEKRSELKAEHASLKRTAVRTWKHPPRPKLRGTIHASLPEAVADRPEFSQAVGRA